MARRAVVDPDRPGRPEPVPRPAPRHSPAALLGVHVCLGPTVWRRGVVDQATVTHLWAAVVTVVVRHCRSLHRSPYSGAEHLSAGGLAGPHLVLSRSAAIRRAAIARARRRARLSRAARSAGQAGLDRALCADPARRGTRELSDGGAGTPARR